MKKPTILLVTISKKVCKTFEENLKMFFGSKISIETCYESLQLNKEIISKADLVILSSPELEYCTESLKPNIPVMVARRSIRIAKLEPLLDLAPKTKILLVTNDIKNVRDSIDLLHSFGFGHLTLVPYVPEVTNAQEAENFEFSITLGQVELVPRHIKKVIDLENRPIDLTTMLDIARLLNLSLEKAHFYTAEFFRDFVKMGRSLSLSIQNEKELTQKLESVLNAVHEGIIGLDEKGFITLINEDAHRILQLPSINCIGKHYNEVIPNFQISGNLEGQKEQLDSIFQINNRSLLVSKVPLTFNQKLIGLVITFQDVTRVQRMEQEIRRKSTELGLTTKYSFDNIIGNSPLVVSAKQKASRLAKSDYTVLITGENGTGKEVFAQAIHNSSERKEGPFVAVNFAGLTETLIESELFGYEGGAFTGAKKEGKMGLFELAHNGTIFMDEIGDASLSIQASLLRVLQERQVMRVGGHKVIPINVRVIAATNKNLQEMIKKGTFREDLYYRLNVLPLNIPPLRERKEDLFTLIDFFFKLNKKNLVFDSDVKNLLINYNWPGNIRELENFIHYLMVIVEGNKVIKDHMPDQILLSQETSNLTNDSLSEIEEAIIFLKRGSFAEDYKAILKILTIYKKQETSVGRGIIQEMLPYFLSDSQLKHRLSMLNKVNCIKVGVRKQGTEITELGIEVLSRFEDLMTSNEKKAVISFK
ncbi:sigma-54 interaction domain-containing protein [Priestia megaterium]|uniref:sigma-54 interaction domain-containing protein n=1 Tax=Priestia megaterium TaxID=1404 RepID=UPI002E23FED8|nr:sigma 54-interacting transcriptional regulator [Priestia megaterium]MED4235703.1 sigma 54-interacting transcriptional regulator [Priestia megaterium]MED4268044.1 sigma 54-interacting transcriptional regulator [Priestia megaterium]MED4279292.1 sigma 54-interacting transcriptional regulator [Priestia megaterium]MED4319562.1 sigma 54-interacting transcriptional regulator [Priestia megaterium]